MADITATLLAASGDAVDRTVYTTASQSPSADNLVLLHVMGQVASGTSALSSVVGNGLTWVLVDTRVISVFTTSVYRAMGAAPSSGTVALTFSAEQTAASWVFVEFDNVDTGGSDGADAVVQASNTRDTTGTVITHTLSAFADAANATYGANWSNAGTGTFTEGTGFTKIKEQLIAIQLGTGIEFRKDNDTSVDMTWDLTGDQTLIGVEIRNASAPLSTGGTSGSRGKMGFMF